ncbi:hypothetical protein CROQUDRAFT_436123 [Cronartium quercuum f. sp. fusiforme G11]|uniref:Uncharacterized protein n=1 Tax=Cronartium quercuum f. sp. fusiforme G11 TaxID=708437 RepID=A0A9P6NM34_9BASI|nr:hypothetical protein CROQUDRAFT_436123 [Cronartium quercuum f. sp. fusiforme G11]
MQHDSYMTPFHLPATRLNFQVIVERLIHLGTLQTANHRDSEGLCGLGPAPGWLLRCTSFIMGTLRLS